MRFARMTTALSSLALLLGGCAGLPSQQELREVGQPSSLFQMAEAPLTAGPAMPVGQPPAPQLWRVPAFFDSATAGDEGVEIGVGLYRTPTPAAPAVQPTFPLEDAVFPERARRTSWHVTFDRRPDPVWFQRRSAVDPFPLFESAQVGRMLADSPRAGGLGNFTGLLTSEDGPALVGGYRFEF